MTEYGIFNDDDECVEGEFHTREKAEEAIRTRYSLADGLRVEIVEYEDEGVSDQDDDHPNHCQSCEQWFSDDSFVSYFDKCQRCAEGGDM